VAAGLREEIPETVDSFTASLISRCWDDDPHKRPTFLEIFGELQEHHFKIFSVVDPEAVDEFLQSLS
jgi:hypothetical protein